MIQFNLLPDIKMEYVKARRTKRNVVLISFLSSGVMVAVFVLLFVTVNLFQKQHMDNLTEDIKTTTNKLEQIDDLDKIITIQNQLNNVNGLHDAKPVVSRFYTYLPQLVPANTGSQFTSISGLKVDVELSTMSFTGKADSLATVNKFVDTLKFTTYADDQENKVTAFKDVVLTSFSSGSEDTSYTIDLSFDPVIFDSRSEVALVVPNIISTRSETQKPSENLFKAQDIPAGGAQ